MWVSMLMLEVLVVGGVAVMRLKGFTSCWRSCLDLSRSVVLMG
ncbi:MAG TPA: hypothetical protein EYH08_05670 [Pyrodictium sp.]|nr:hypothetical protein [Pyrodictium sp.]HIQ56134.1 hypothetical protein [Pyrodictium sp.]